MLISALDREEIMDRLNSLAADYNKELKKPLGERDTQKVNQLLWARFYEGLKLSPNSGLWLK